MVQKNDEKYIFSRSFFTPNGIKTSLGALLFGIIGILFFVQGEFSKGIFTELIAVVIGWFFLTNPRNLSVSNQELALDDRIIPWEKVTLVIFKVSFGDKRNQIVEIYLSETVKKIIYLRYYKDYALFRTIIEEIIDQKGIPKKVAGQKR